MTVLASLFLGAVFGLALAAPPGPMNAVIARESVARGWLAGVAAGLGAMVADLCFFVLSLAGVATIVASAPRLRAAMVGAGGLLMLWFASGAAREALAGTDWGAGEAGRGFRQALAFALTNPYQVAFWLTVGVGLLQPGTVDVLGTVAGGAAAGVLVVRTGGPALLVGLFAGIGVWVLCFPASLVVAGRRIDAFAPLVAGTSAGVLAVAGAWFLLDAAGTLL